LYEILTDGIGLIYKKVSNILKLSAVLREDGVVIIPKA